uniref:collagen alpha-3(IX) chain-like n=1 Tax=Panthera onca TaxID=9690 RepID=UPI0029550F7E|nr:collagen alpha-3(IX) chain-like [Panthera onca]
MAAERGPVSPAPALGPAWRSPPGCQRAGRTPHRPGSAGSAGARAGPGGGARGRPGPAPGSENLCGAPREKAGGGPGVPSRPRLLLPRGPGVSRAPTCQPSLPDVLPQQIPGSGRGVPQLLADGPPELRWEGFPFAGHFRSVRITTSERARHRHSRVARNSDSRRPETPGAGLPLGSRDPPRARHGSAAVPRWGLLRARGPRCAARPEPSKFQKPPPSPPPSHKF